MQKDHGYIAIAAVYMFTEGHFMTSGGHYQGFILVNFLNTNEKRANMY